MRLREQALGTRNMVGTRVELIRKQSGMKQKELLGREECNGQAINRAS